MAVKATHTRAMDRNLAAVEALALGPAPAVADAGRAGSAGLLAQHLSMAPIPAVRQKRSNELSTSCQAVARLGTSASDEVVVVLVMLLSFADSTPRA